MAPQTTAEVAKVANTGCRWALIRSQSVDGTELDGKPPTVMGLALGEVVQQLQDLRIAEGIANALGLEHFRKRRRGAVDGLEVSTLHRPVQEAVELLTGGLTHP